MSVIRARFGISPKKLRLTIDALKTDPRVTREVSAKSL